MAFKDLTSKLKKGILAATVGLASLAYAPKADGQALINLGAEVTSLTHVPVSGPLQEGQTYLINLTIQNIDPAGIPGADLDFKSIFAGFKASYDGTVATSNNTDFTYVSSVSGQEGNPVNADLFNGTPQVTNNYSPITSEIDYDLANFNRSTNITTGFPTLDFGEKANIATFLFTPHIGSAGGTVSLTYDPLIEPNFMIRDGANFAYGDAAYKFFQGANQINFNIAAVPEPSTYALFAGGAALVGAAAYRAKRRRENSKKN